MKRIILTLISTAALSAAGCADNTSCAGDDECFMGEVCVDEVCQRPDDDTNNANNANNANNDTTQSNTPNNASNNETANNTPGNSSPNNANNETNNTTPVGECRGDAFDSCEADTDASTPTHVTSDTTYGCVQPNDDFAPGTVSTQAVICPLEDSDRFTFNVNPCATIPYVLDVEVIPRDMCPPDLFDLDVSLNANDCAEGNGLVECTDSDTPGGKTASLVVEPSSNTRVLYLDVLALEENLLFEYDVTVTFRQ